MATARKPKTVLSIEDQIKQAKLRLAELEAQKDATKFEIAIKKHQTAAKQMYQDLLVASGTKKAGAADVAILAAVATAMDMKNMVISKKAQRRNK